MRKKKLATLAGISAIAATALLSTAPAQATTSNVGWWQEGDFVCPYNNGVSVVPVVITNASAVTRTGSFTIPTAIVDAVQVSPNMNAINCNNGSAKNGYSTDFTVAPGETTVMWVGLGTSGQQVGQGSHNIGFGGLPSGTPGASWYDMGLTLDNATTLLTGGNTFNNLTATYQNTGGINLATNKQDGFVLTSCQTMPDGSIYPSSNILTPYNNGAWTSGPVYGYYEAICAAWMPEGTYVPFTNAGSTPFTVQAAQTYGPSNGLVAMAGSGTAVINTAAVNGTNIPVNTPSNGPWVGQDPVTKQWFLANATPPAGVPVILDLNGQDVGTVNAGT